MGRAERVGREGCLLVGDQMLSGLYRWSCSWRCKWRRFVVNIPHNWPDCRCHHRGAVAEQQLTQLNPWACSRNKTLISIKKWGRDRRGGHGELLETEWETQIWEGDYYRDRGRKKVGREKGKWGCVNLLHADTFVCMPVHFIKPLTLNRFSWSSQSHGVIMLLEMLWLKTLA